MSNTIYEAFEGPKTRLSKTEKQIVLAYLNKRRKAKELAKILRVSPRTVYKALYKYRLNLKALGLSLDDASREYIREKEIKTTEKESLILREKLTEEIRKVVRETLSNMLGFYPYPAGIQTLQSKDLVELLRRLEKNIEKLSQNIEKLTLVISNIGVDMNMNTSKSYIESDNFSENIVPSFVHGNPWLTVLKSRGKET